VLFFEFCGFRIVYGSDCAVFGGLLVVVFCCVLCFAVKCLLFVVIFFVLLVLYRYGLGVLWCRV